MRIEDLHIEDGVDTHLHIVPRNADLLGHVEGLFLQAVPVGNTLYEWNEDMKSRMQCAAVLAEILNTYALCCGTTVAVRAITITATIASAMNT
jgi:hypothetical protein